MLATIALFGLMLAPGLASGIEVAPRALAPVNASPPVLTGTPAPGQTLSCSPGTWTNSPTTFSYAWLRSGVPIAGQTGSTYVVQAADQGHTIACRVTAGNSGGSYTITGLATGSYKVAFYPAAGVNELTQYFNGKGAEAEATPVAVTVPTTTAGVNAELHVGGQINGRVTAAATHTPIAKINVCAESVSHEAFNCAETSSNGEYTIVGLPSGSYTVVFSTFLLFEEESGYLAQYFNDKPSSAGAQAIGVTAGTTVTGVNAELQSVNQGGQIAGTVSKASGGAPIEGIQVCASLRGEGFLDRCATTNSKGEYTLSSLPEGEFDVFFSGANCQSGPCTFQNYIPQYYNGVASEIEATPVIVLAHNTTPGIGAKMVEGGQIEGRATSAAAGEPPLANTEVCASGSETFACGETNSNGEYKIEGLPTGSSYSVIFFALAANYLDSTVEHVSVTAGTTTHGVDAKLLVGGQVSGRVTDASTHAGLGNVVVCARLGILGRCTATNANGEYTITTLSTGTYTVNFEPGNTTAYVLQSLGGVSVTAGSTTANINAELHTGGQISGLVTDASTHLGVANVTVCAEGVGGKCALTQTGAAPASAVSNALTVPSGDFTQTKSPSFNSKTDDIDFFFKFPTAGTLKWSLFFKNADVGFADSLGISLGQGAPVGEVARKGKKAAKCKKGEVKRHGKCKRTLVPFASGSENVAAGMVEVKVHADAKAIKALNARHTLHVSGTFTFQSALGGPAVSHNVSATVKMPPKQHHKGKGKR